MSCVRWACMGCTACRADTRRRCPKLKEPTPPGLTRGPAPRPHSNGRYPHLNEEVARLLHEADLRRESPRLLSALFSRKHAPPLVGSLLLALSNAWANSLQ